MSNKATTTDINILSIDGGGIRGMLSAEILIYIEDKLKELTGKDIKIGDFFDLIAGTSTGGILTSIYSFPDRHENTKYSARDARDIYLNHGSNIFKKEAWQRVKTVFGLFGPKYRPDNLKAALDKYFQVERISRATTNMMLTSVNIKNNSLHLFKSYHAITNKNDNVSFTDACLATASAPTLFPPHQIKLPEGEKITLIDGGMALNNPALSAYIEAQKLYPNRKINLLSIGSARQVIDKPYNKVRKWGILKWVQPLINLMLISSAKGVDYQAQVLFNNQITGNYYRINPLIGDADPKPDNASSENISKLQAAGQQTVTAYQKEIDDYLKKIIK